MESGDIAELGRESGSKRRVDFQGRESLDRRMKGHDATMLDQVEEPVGSDNELNSGNFGIRSCWLWEILIIGGLIIGDF